MQHIILTQGLPASGKTTWAIDWKAVSPMYREIVCRDDLRFELFGIPKATYKPTRAREKQVTLEHDARIIEYINQGKDVCVADTNLNPSYVQHLKNLGKKLGATVTKQSFAHVPLVECLQRNERRQDRVSEAAIINMWERYLKKESNITRLYEVTNPFRPSCIVCDLDGTLCNNSQRNPHDPTKYAEDTLIVPTYSVLVTHSKAYGAISPIIYASGRREQYRGVIMDWLQKHNCPNPENLYLRPDDDDRKDWRVKEDMAHKILKHRTIQMWMDDRYSVTTHLRTLGITVHSVNFGRF